MDKYGYQEAKAGVLEVCIGFMGHRDRSHIAYGVSSFASIGCTIFSRQSKHTGYSGALRHLDKVMHRVINVWKYMDILDVRVGSLSLYIFMDMSK